MALERTRHVEFVRVEGPPLDEAASTSINLWWDARVSAHPGMFDGPMLAVQSCKFSREVVVVNWYRTTYSRYLWRQAANTGQIHYARALFVSALLVTGESEIMVGRMGAQTSTPHRWQLPGGNVELTESPHLSLADCLASAIIEVREEIGIDVSKAAANLWRIKHGGDFGDLGLIFRFETGLSRSQLVASFGDHQDSLRARGILPELEAIWIGKAAELVELLPPDGTAFGAGESAVDYLGEVAHVLARDQPLFVQDARDE